MQPSDRDGNESSAFQTLRSSIAAASNNEQDGNQSGEGWMKKQVTPTTGETDPKGWIKKQVTPPPPEGAEPEGWIKKQAPKGDI